MLSTEMRAGMQAGANPESSICTTSLNGSTLPSTGQGEQLQQPVQLRLRKLCAHIPVCSAAYSSGSRVLALGCDQTLGEVPTSTDRWWMREGQELSLPLTSVEVFVKSLIPSWGTSWWNRAWRQRTSLKTVGRQALGIGASGTKSC